MAGIIIPIVCYVVIALVIGRLSWSIWEERRAKRSADARPIDEPPPVTHASAEEIERRRKELRDQLSHKALGAERARQLWARLQQARIGEGLVHQFHRDFCGHGLIRTEAGIILCDSLDGAWPGPAIATWDNEVEFVDFFSRQSDFSMSGWDPAEPVFFTEDSWYRDNQRLTAAIIARFINHMNG